MHTICRDGSESLVLYPAHACLYIIVPLIVIDR